MTEWLPWLAIAHQPQTEHGWTEGNRVLDLILKQHRSQMSVALWWRTALDHGPGGNHAESLMCLCVPLCLCLFLCLSISVSFAVPDIEHSKLYLDG